MTTIIDVSSIREFGDEKRRLLDDEEQVAKFGGVVLRFIGTPTRYGPWVVWCGVIDGEKEAEEK